MKTATVADLRNDFSRVASWIEDGETVGITKDGRPFAQMSAIPKGSEKPARKKLDFMAQLREIWGDKVFTKEEVQAMRDAELEGEEG